MSESGLASPLESLTTPTSRRTRNPLVLQWYEVDGKLEARWIDESSIPFAAFDCAIDAIVAALVEAPVEDGLEMNFVEVRKDQPVASCEQV